ncbi:hypothetical protein OAU50_08880 [Planctomycetota bacterium]|nr:hypothetical protein [Planctomycetota bacterium]
MNVIKSALLFLLVLSASAIAAQDAYTVKSLTDIKNLDKDAKAVEIKFNDANWEDGLLATLADSHSHIEKLTLVGSSIGGVRPLNRLVDFADLKYLKIKDTYSNFAYVNDEGVSELDYIVKLSKLETFILDGA